MSSGKGRQMLEFVSLAKTDQKLNIVAQNLKTQALSGVIWSFIQRFGSMAIAFVSNIVLARLLTPDDYGTIGMLMIFIAVANTFVDGGFGSALIQKKEPTKEDYSTIFWWNMFLSTVIYAILYVSAPAISRFYDLPILCDVLRVQGLVLIINALSIIQQNQLRKQLKFKRLAVVTVIAAVLSAGIAIYLAYINWGVWALVAQQLLLSLFTAIILWVLNRWCPNIVFSKESFRQLFSFGGFILLSNLINTLCNNIQGLLIGKFFVPATLGFFTQAKKLEEVASTSISSVIDQVTYPIFSSYQDNKESLLNVLRMIVTTIAYVTIPILFLLILLAKPIIITLYTEVWAESIPYFKILCLAGVAICMQGIHYYSVASVGRSKELFNWTIIKRVLTLIVVMGGLLLFGIYGLLFGTAIGSWIIYICNAYLSSKFIGYSFKKQFCDLIPIILIAIVAYSVAYYVGLLISENMYISGVINIFAFISTYIFVSYMLKLKTLYNIISLSKDYIKRIMHK